ncbi:MAG TPA: SEC-C metal-binding domain-containing protein [Kofleriaceae bacterium]|nr:SEC-C metal-binding domain-containing protein [Kofleriaceae bacterium]
MAAERNRVFAGERISRAQLEAASDCSEAAIRAALAGLDHERAAMLAIARARREPVPVELVAEILPGIEFPAITCALIAIASGDRATLLDLLEHRRFPVGKDTAELEAIVLFAAWRGGAPLARVIPELRRLAARSMTAAGYALLATIAAAIDDPNVAAATKHLAPYPKEYAKQLAADERAMTASVEQVIAALPAEVETSRGGFTVRGAKQPGRNDPCPCGSGLKYKKCCADKPVAMPSPVPGLSWDEFLGAGADRMTAEHVLVLELRDLARVDLGRLATQPLRAAFRRFVRARAWDHAERALDLLIAREPEQADDDRDELIDYLLECRERARARAHVARLVAPERQYRTLELAAHDDPAAAWRDLVELSERALRGGDNGAELDLAYTLLRASPALGIHAARACIGARQVDDADMLLDTVEDARDRLGLPPTDPAWRVLDQLTEREPSAKPPDEAALREQLLSKAAQVDQLERALSALRGELDAERTRPAAALARAPEASAGALEGRVRELEALIREGNAERRELRTKLQAADGPKRADEAPRTRREAAAEPDDADTEAVPQGARGVVVPRFDRRVIDALAEVPAPVAAEAMRTIGTLAAGDGFAWRNVKQAKDMTRQVLMARVGIHHRLLFRVDDGALDALDLITREQLLTTLKRLRAKG